MPKINIINYYFQSIIVAFLLCTTHGSVYSQLQFPEKTELFRDEVVPRIDITIDPSSLNYILDPINSENNGLFTASFIFSNDNVTDTVENVGFRLRGNTSRNAQKKSFKLDINAFVPGRKFYGVTKINLNGQHNDPTSARAKICADLADMIGIPSLRTNHVALYINDEYFGLYTNVEHIDQNYVKKRFGNKNGNLYKCLYPADLDYKGDNPDAYKEIIYGRRNYELKNNNETDDYSDFANFVKVLNLTSNANFACEIEKVFNVDQYLKFIIFDILTGNWDGPIYNKNNFYLYHNQETDLFEYIPYDLDNTLGIDWLNRDWGNRDIYSWSKTSAARPLYNRIMEVQEYRDRFSYYLQDILLNVYNEAELYPYLDDMRSKLKPYIENDTYYTLDYGFNVEHFENGFEYQLPFFQTDYGIKEFIQTRLIAAFAQLEINNIKPIITEIRHNHPNVNENIEIQAKVIDDGSFETMVCIAINDGPEECFEMKDDGLQNDGDANDGVYGIVLPPTFDLGEINYKIIAIDDTDQESTMPRCGVNTFYIEEEQLKLAVNEFMASNNVTIADINGEYDDWIELYNYGSTPIYLGDKYLSDNPDNRDKWQMPNYTIEGGEYLLFWSDDDRNQGTFHTNFKLSKSGEYVGIYDNDATVNELIDGIEYEEQSSDTSFGRLPNGTGDFVHLLPSPGAPNMITNTTDLDQNIFDIDVFPNPTDDIIQISSDHKVQKVNIFNCMGKEVNFSPINNNQLSLPNEKGIYFLHIILEDNISVIKKVIKI